MTNARPPGRVRSAAGMTPTILLALATGIGTGCNRNPATPQCIGALEIELSSEEINPGDTFTASATHRIPECITSLSWTATGVIELRFAEQTGATFLAREEGNGTITVRNRQGSLGVLEVEVVPPDESGAARVGQTRY